MTALRALRLFAALTCAALPDAAAASDYKTFRDWVAVCDNLRNCSAYGLEPESGPGTAYLRIERGGAANAPARVTVAVDMADASAFRLAFDDPALPGLPKGPFAGNEGEGNDFRRVVLAEGAAADPLIAALRKAKSITVTRQPAPGKKLDQPVTTISLSGAVAALLWIDDQQKRIDTTTAMIRRGNKPASSIPPQPQAPVVTAAAPGKTAVPKEPPQAVMARGLAACGEDNRPAKRDSVAVEDIQPLGRSEAIYMFHCRELSGAYNMYNAFVIAPANNPRAARLASFVRPRKSGDDDAFTMNAMFDETTNTVRTFIKGRGLGDCGTEEQWVYDGKAFQLAETRFMPECRGVQAEDWPVLYRAEVRQQ